MKQQEKTPEQVKLEKTIEEYIKMVTDRADNIGLMGHQPRLRKIRESYHNGELSNSDLILVLTALAQELGGEAEPYKSVQDFANHAFKDMNWEKPAPKPQLTAAEQAAAIKDILGDKKKSKPRKKAEPKPIVINKAALPEHLRHLAK